jgi:hypothetical protein
VWGEEMSINIIPGIRTLEPKQGETFVRQEYNGNVTIEFVHPTKAEQEFLHDVVMMMGEMYELERLEQEK